MYAVRRTVIVHVYLAYCRVRILLLVTVTVRVCGIIQPPPATHLRPTADSIALAVICVIAIVSSARDTVAVSSVFFLRIDVQVVQLSAIDA